MPRRVVGGDPHHAPDGPAQIADLLAVELQDGGHRASAVGDRLLHEEPALADEMEGVFERKGLRHHQGRVLADAMSRQPLGVAADGAEVARLGDLEREQRRLQDRRMAQIVGRAFPHRSPQRELQHLVGALEQRRAVRAGGG